MKFISHNLFLKHFTGKSVESAERLEGILENLDFEEAENGIPYLHLFHSDAYINFIRDYSKGLGEKEIKPIDEHNETFVSKDTFGAACYAVGATVQAGEYAKKGQSSFALVRPPGHHAHRNYSHGFCIFNNMAISALNLVFQDDSERVMIVDLDMHKGDGTIEAVEGQHNLFYVSFHLAHQFPYTCEDEVDNVRLLAYAQESGDDQIIPLLENEIVKDIEVFKPTLVAISAGFDVFESEKELSIPGNLSPMIYKTLLDLIYPIPFFAVLEGGYNPLSVEQGLEVFKGY